MYKYYEAGFKSRNLSLKEKFFNINFGYVFCIILLAAIGVITLYSAANGNWSPWAYRQMVRFGFALGIMLALALIDVRIYLKYSYMAYFLVLLLCLTHGQFLTY